MSNRNLVVGTLIGTAFLFLIDYLFYGVLMADKLTTFVMRDSPDFLFLIIGYLIFSVFFTFVAGRYEGSMDSLSQGFIFGLVIGFMIFSLTTLIRYATEPLDMGQVLTTLVFDVLKIGLLGALFTLVLKGTVGSRDKNTGGGH
ncbi:MAG TPA: hypothetical protein P5275_18230 [Saprospiraceae bacterium]|nr:hypothetical protein [Lewinellaceae bacterium]HPQ99271.1 hypothetical protein [Saprospiraceae bacterium]HRV86819.1 hypothetical protein [Saprospiraceae bacterium]